MDTTPRKRVKILTLHEHTAKKQREIASIVELLRESKKDPRKTSDMLRKDLLSSGVNVSSSTVRRRLIE